MNVHGAGHVPKSHINFADSDVNKKNSGTNIGQTKPDVNEARSLTSKIKLSELDSAARSQLLNQIKSNIETGSLSTREAAESVANAILDS